MPCGGPANGRTSHWGELVYAGHDQVDQYQAEHDPPVEECACPAASRRARRVGRARPRLALMLALLLHLLPYRAAPLGIPDVRSDPVLVTPRWLGRQRGRVARLTRLSSRC